MNIIFINNKLFFLSVILAFIAGCSDGSKSSGGPVVGIADLSPGIAVSSSVDVEEGDDGSQIAAVGFTASTDGIVNYTTYDIDAVAKSDYLPQSGQYEMQAGQSYEIGIEILSDTRVEADEKVGVLITDESGEELGRLVATILNDDYPNYTLTASDITEGHLGTQFLEFTIELSEPTVAPFPLTVTTTDLVQVGSALAGTDYTAINSELVFVAGELSKTVEVEVFGDRDIELDETIELKVEHLGISEVVANGTIRSDDTPGNGAPTFRFNEGRSITIAENGTPEELVMKFKIDESGGFTEDFVVNYRLASLASDVIISGDETGKAEEDQDFSTAVGQITILAAQDSLANEYTASFELVDDELLENNEVLEMVLFNDAGVEFGSGRIYIVDDESPEFKIYRKYTDLSGEEQITTDLTYLEDSDYLGRREFYVELAGQVGYDYQFELVLRYLNDGEEGNAIDPDDVQGSGGANQKIISKIIDIDKGNSFSVEEGDHVISFSMEEDSLVEANERMMIELRSSNGGTLGEAIPVNILNDDLPLIRWANTDFSTDVFESNEETPLNLILQLDNGELSVDQQFGDPALEDFDISIVRSITEGSESKVCSVKTQSDLSTEELTITTEGLQVYSVSSNTVPVILAFVDDTDAECDEVVDLTVTLKSQSSRVNEYLAQLSGWEDRSNQVTVTSKNTDEATLTITGFNVTEDLEGGVVNFTAILNQEITLSAAFSVTSDGAEAGGADDNGDGVISYNTNPIAFDVANTFEFSGGIKERNISIAINNDSIVEIDENYILNVVMDNDYPVKLASISTVTTKTCGAIGLGCLHVDDEIQTTSVEGKIVSEDRTSLVFNATTSEGFENDLAGNAIFTITTELEIASDVPTIKYLLTEVCNDNCAIMQGNVINSEIGADDFTIANVVIHEKSTEGAPNTPQLSVFALPLVVIGDGSIEPDEVVKINSTLINFGALDDLSSDSISHYVNADESQVFKLTIKNDDTVKPYFVGTPDLVSGFIESETDEGNSESNVERIINIAWDEDIAANLTTALSINLNTVCTECTVTENGAVNPDVSYGAGDNAIVIHAGTGSATPLNPAFSIGLTVEQDKRVEPDETISLTMNGGTTNFVENGKNTKRKHTIKNDDVVNPTFVKIANKFEYKQNESVADAGVFITWEEDIDANAPAISLAIGTNCNDECALFGEAQADINFVASTTYSIYTKTAPDNVGRSAPGTAGVSIGLLVTNADDIVEPNEKLTLTLASGTTGYVDVAGLDTFDYTILNDDFIKPRFTAASANHTEKADSDGSVSADVKISWLENVASNVGALSLNLTAFCDTDECTLSGSSGADVNYGASKNVTLSVADLASKIKTLDLTVAGDDLVEPDETLVLTLNSNSGYFNSADSTQKTFALTIKNDDTVKPYFVGTPAVSGFIETEADEGNSESNVERVINIAWDENIAANLKTPLSINLNTVCTECTVTENGAVNPDVSYGAGDNAIVIHAGTGSATPLNPAFSIGLTVEQDKRVEPDETISLTMNGGTTNFVENGKNTKRKHTIKNDDYVDVAVTSPNKKEGTVAGNATYSNADITLSWTQEIDSNVPTLNATVSTVCDTSVSNSICTLTGTYADIGSVSTSITIPIIASSKVISIPVKQDDFIEVDEVINVSFTPAESIKAFFKNNNIPTSSLTIQDLGDASGGDSIAVTLTANKTVSELDGSISSISWAEQRIESHSVFTFSATLSGNEYVKAEDVLFQKDGSTGCTQSGSVLTCTVTLSANRMLPAVSNMSLMSVVDDVIVELDESMTLTATSVNAGVPVLGSIAVYKVDNNDHLSFSFNSSNVTTEGSSSIMLEESNLTNLYLTICNVDSSPMEGGDLQLDITTQAQQFITDSTIKSKLRIHDASPSDYSVLENIVYVGSNKCTPYQLQTTEDVDVTSEPNESLGVVVKPSIADVRCSNNSYCMGSETTTADHGLVVIKNDDFESFIDTGVDKCLNAAGSGFDSFNPENNASVCSPAEQDVEITRTELSFVKLNSAGNPVVEASSDYSCISEGSTGLTWARRGVETDDLTSDADNDDVLTADGAEILYTTTTLAGVTTANIKLCGKSGWGVPTVTQLLDAADYQYLNSLDTAFENKVVTGMKYWSSEVCNGGQWVFDYAAGQALCAASSDTHHVRVVTQQ